MFAAYLDDDVSPGGISELIYAAFREKDILIFYKVEDRIEYEFQTSNWYPCVSAIQIRGKDHVKLIPVKDKEEMISYLRKGNRKEKGL